jgi:transcriptional regulator with XRE-family HTH domain
MCQNIKDDKFLLLLGKRIKELRNKKGLSQLELAVNMENHAEQIGRIERGKHNDQFAHYVHIINSFDISLSELFIF